MNARSSIRTCPASKQLFTMITPLRILQSCPMWTPVMIKLPSPRTVELPSVAPRWMVQCSRITLASPITIRLLVCVSKPRSCGTLPMIEPCPMKLPVPIRTGPSITTCDWIRHRSPITASAPTTENGPISTSRPSWAFSSTIAVG